MDKIYKRKIYWLVTTKFAGSLAVDQNGRIFKYDTSPCYRWMEGKNFGGMISYLKRKKILIECKRINVDIDPF